MDRACRQFVHFAFALLPGIGCSGTTANRAQFFAHKHTRCHVHDCLLIEETKIVGETRQELFVPERYNQFPLAGDDTDWSQPGHVKFASLMYCPHCRKAKAKYMREVEGKPVGTSTWPEENLQTSEVSGDPDVSLGKEGEEIVVPKEREGGFPYADIVN